MRSRFRPSPAMIVACITLFALRGTATAVTYVVSSNSQIGPNPISGHKPPTGKHSNVIAGSVNRQDVADNSLGGRRHQRVDAGRGGIGHARRLGRRIRCQRFLQPGEPFGGHL